MTKNPLNITVLYSFIAGLSIIINIGAQLLSLWIYTGLFGVEISILVGTSAGLPFRYILDKKLIFQYQSQNVAHDGRLFFLYSFMGIFTTAIFWGLEYTFHWILDTDLMRYLGGIIGLGIGFYVKYQLDKKYVFGRGYQEVLV